MIRLLLPLLLLTGPSLADTRGLVVVLPADTHAAKLDEGALTGLEESIRTITASVLGEAGFTVLSNETTLEVLRANGLDASKVCEASCALEAARELKASHFVSSVVTRSEGELLAIVRLFESASGRQLQNLQLEAKTVKELRHAFEARAGELFAPLTRRSGRLATLVAVEPTATQRAVPTPPLPVDHFAKSALPAPHVVVELADGIDDLKPVVSLAIPDLKFEPCTTLAKATPCGFDVKAPGFGKVEVRVAEAVVASMRLNATPLKRLAWRLARSKPEVPEAPALIMLGIAGGEVGLGVLLLSPAFGLGISFIAIGSVMLLVYGGLWVQWRAKVAALPDWQWTLEPVTEGSPRAALGAPLMRFDLG